GIIVGLDHEAQVYLDRKDAAAVARLLEQASAVGRDLDSVRSLALFHSHVGDAALHGGDLVTAHRELGTALNLLNKHGRRGDLGYTVGELTLVAVYRGELDRADAYVEQVSAQVRELAQKRGLALLLCAHAQIALLRGDVDRARALAREASITWPGLAAL